MVASAIHASENDRNNSSSVAVSGSAVLLLHGGGALNASSPSSVHTTAFSLCMHAQHESRGGPANTPGSRDAVDPLGHR